MADESDPLIDWDPQRLLSERGVAAGQWCRAHRADWLNDMVNDPERPVDPAPPDTVIEGVLYAAWVDALKYWQFSIRGQSIDPSTAEAAPEWVTWRRRYRDAGASGDPHGWVKRKPLVEDGVCAEIAVRDELARPSGWEAVWVRNAVGLPLRFWSEMPRDLSDRVAGAADLPDLPRSALDDIDPNWRRGGVLDVVGWNVTTGDVRFAEAKRQRTDRLRANQLRFIRLGREGGYPAESFIVVEWDYL